ncbi:alcohol dehydrogenase catalytic domain-containing protein [Kitasatospora sp. NPDC048722]|uniref:alcohol dehydrogenase catalytic domain-containing protein n=1 Tax=Kitasatospora sp. NPDC048722 TaxID=3155639 RepID=UPI0033C8D21E
MRAVIQKAFGGPEVLEVAEVERPKLRGGEVLVRVRASAVNPVDVAVRSGAFPLLGEPPFGVGWDVSGVVEEAAPGARYRVGEEVYGMPFFPRAATGYAEYVAAPSRQLARKPATLDHVRAAALPLAALTAWQGLVDLAGVTKGQRVLRRRRRGRWRRWRAVRACPGRRSPAGSARWWASRRWRT